MRRHQAAVSATLAAWAFICGSGVMTAAAAAPQPRLADAALRYLYSQVGADGSIAGAVGPTEDTVIGTADNGFDPATLTSAVSGASAYGYLAAHRTAVNTAGGAAKYVLAWLAAGRPSILHGRAMLARLNTPVTSGGFLQPNGAFHSGDPAVETANSFSQALAVLADVGAGHPLPAHATGWLACAQRTDGGFGYAISDSSPLPPASCGDASSDTNDTGIVLQALGMAGRHTADAGAEAYLRSIQKADGGFGFNGAGTSSDPDSDVAIIEALVAIGQDPVAAGWTSAAGGNPLADLDSFADPLGSGGYAFQRGSPPDAFTTSAVPAALALKTYGAATAIIAGAVPPPVTPATPAPAGGVLGVSVPGTGASLSPPGEPPCPSRW